MSCHRLDLPPRAGAAVILWRCTIGDAPRAGQPADQPPPALQRAAQAVIPLMSSFATSSGSLNTSIARRMIGRLRRWSFDYVDAVGDPGWCSRAAGDEDAVE
jgi:hypothetical protein